MKPSILILYYSQTGQLRSILDSLFSEQQTACDLDRITYFLPHLSSEFFRPKIMDELAKIGYPIPAKKWFANLTRVGNIGSASPYLMLEELFNEGKIKKRVMSLF